MGQRNLFFYKTSMRRKNGIRTAMCRLDVDADRKEADQTGDVLSSSRYRLGRGVKRKLSDYEESSPGPGMPYPQQRQLVLDLCLNKLQSCHSQAEPSLHRSVLLANTLRQIQEEMSQEGAPSQGEPSQGAPLACSALGCSVSPEDARLPDIFGSFEMTNSTSYLTDLALDDIFEDIDTSMYDPSDFSVLAFLPPRPGVVQSTATDEGLKSFSSCTSASALQLCITDLNELDHIMEVLVRS